MVLYTGWGKRKFPVVCMEKNTIIIRTNTKISSVFCILTTVSLLEPRPVLLVPSTKSDMVATAKNSVE